MSAIIASMRPNQLLKLTEEAVDDFCGGQPQNVSVPILTTIVL